MTDKEARAAARSDRRLMYVCVFVILLVLAILVITVVLSLPDDQQVTAWVVVVLIIFGFLSLLVNAAIAGRDRDGNSR